MKTNPHTETRAIVRLQTQMQTLKLALLERKSSRKFIELQKSLLVSFSVTHTYKHSIFPLPLSTCLTHHYPCEARRQPWLGKRGRRGGITGNVSRHMSKVQPVSWKSCVWCDSSPPAANPEPSSHSSTLSSQEKKLPVLALRERESKREPAGRVSHTTPLG